MVLAILKYALFCRNFDKYIAQLNYNTNKSFVRETIEIERDP